MVGAVVVVKVPASVRAAVLVLTFQIWPVALSVKTLPATQLMSAAAAACTPARVVPARVGEAEGLGVGLAEVEGEADEEEAEGCGLGEGLAVEAVGDGTSGVVVALGVGSGATSAAARVARAVVVSTPWAVKLVGARSYCPARCATTWSLITQEAWPPPRVALAVQLVEPAVAPWVEVERQVVE